MEVISWYIIASAVSAVFWIGYIIGKTAQRRRQMVDKATIESKVQEVEMSIDKMELEIGLLERLGEKIKEGR